MDLPKLEFINPNIINIANEYDIQLNSIENLCFDHILRHLIAKFLYDKKIAMINFLNLRTVPLYQLHQMHVSKFPFVSFFYSFFFLCNLCDYLFLIYNIIKLK